MTFGQSQRIAAQNGTHNGHARCLDGGARQAYVALATRPVDDDALRSDLCIVVPEADRDRCRRLALARYIEYQQNRNIQKPRQIGGGAGATLAAIDAIEQAHGAFNQQQICILCRVIQKMGHQIRLHGPAIKIEAFQTGRRLMETRIDIIGPGFHSAHPDATSRKGAKQANGNAGFSGTGTGRANDKGFGSESAICHAMLLPVTMLNRNDIDAAMDVEGKELRRGWTTGTCSAAAAKAACLALLGQGFPEMVEITLPGGQKPAFSLALEEQGEGFARAGIIKDAGDDPDVTHGALVIATLRRGQAGKGLRFLAGKGVGMVTRPGLPIPPGEPAINPVPRQMIAAAIAEVAGTDTDFEVEISIPDGEELAQKTLNPRLGIVGGLSVLGTTGIVIPFSCSAWIHSIWRGIDVARAEGLTHVAGSTGMTTEKAVQAHHDLPETALLDMGDFVGGMLKYLRKHPVPKVTVAGGVAKMTKLAQGMLDVHSKRGLADLEALAKVATEAGADAALADEITKANSVLHAFQLAEAQGLALGDHVAALAWKTAAKALQSPEIALEVLVFDREGRLVGEAPFTPSDQVSSLPLPERNRRT